MLQTQSNARPVIGNGAANAVLDKLKGSVRTDGGMMSAFMMAIRAYWPVWAVIAAYALGTHWWLGGVFELKQLSLLGLLLGLLPALLLIFVMYRLVAYIASGNPPRHPTIQLWRDLRQLLANRARIVSLALLFPFINLFLQAFAVFKGNIALVHPFSWDETFMRLDGWLHGGRQPWEWLYPLLQSTIATTVVNFVYNFWFFISIGVLLWAVAQRRPREEAVRFLLAFLMVWIVGGSFMALVFSSAGPVYYGRLGLSLDPFAPLMEHLRMVAQSVPVWALETQEMLWRGYQAQDVALGGISAFPSMHNGQATLIALLAWRFGGMVRWSAVAFAVLIAIGSVWLGWHYAVDSYAGIAIAVVSWWLAAPVARWMMRRPAMRQLAQMQQRLDTQAS